MTCDEALYRQYLNGDDAGLEALMKKYGDPLTLYIDGYLHDVHEAEELMLDVFAYLFTKKPRIRDGGFKAYLYKAARRNTSPTPCRCCWWRREGCPSSDYHGSNNRISTP